MIICSMPGCGTSAGCRCAEKFKLMAPLSSYTDEQIAAEHHRRMLAKLGDPRICVSLPVQPTTIWWGNT